MTISSICNRNVATIHPDASIESAAQLMREAHVGDLVVIGQTGASTVPVGMLTDRDIVIEVLAEGVDAKTLRVADIMSTELVSVREDNGLEFALRAMRTNGVRRLPVVDHKGALVGIVSLDEIVQYLTRLANDIGGALEVEQFREAKRRP
jgi:CBS domain-containing protein